MAMRRLRIKICGVTTGGDAQLVAAAGADALGLNFYPGSPRHVSVEQGERILAGLPATICRVGVFVDAPRDWVAGVADRLGLDALQFHGGEPADYCRGWAPRKVIKAIRVRDRDTLRRAAELPVDFILADAYVEGLVGGTGQRAPWEWLSVVDRDRLVLAGGLTPENVAEAVRVVRPAAVDVASGVEYEPGRKDPERVRKFVAHAQNA